MSRGFTLLVLLAFGLSSGCGDDLAGAVSMPDPDAAPMLDASLPPPDSGVVLRPTRLFETGLYTNFTNLAVRSDVTEYVPQFELWADGATKRRWIWLPPGAQIDSSNMDVWSYPEGTKLWKEFSRSGLRVETRLYWKQGPDASDWDAFTFVWNADQNDAIAETRGVKNALGTGHDVPRTFACAFCHRTELDKVLGYSAIQLDGDRGGHKLSDLVASGTLTDNPALEATTAFPLPGGAVEKAALGYLHGNCGHCHNAGAVSTPVPLELRLRTDELETVTGTRSFQTTVGVAPTIPVDGATSIVEPGMPLQSALRLRVGSLADERMPPVASEEVDIDALSAIDTWISSLL